jgi:hypothetical protein
MSSGSILEKVISFEVNLGGSVGQLILAKIDGDSLNSDKILLKLRVDSAQGNVCTNSSNSIIITKENARILKTFFKDAARVVDSWFIED